MPESLFTCNIEPFRYQSTSQPDGEAGSSSNEINEHALQDYIARLQEALCTDLSAILEDCCNGGGGASTFLELEDTPDSYDGAAGFQVVVNDDEDGLEFVEPSTGPDVDGLTLNFSLTEQTTNRTWLSGEAIFQKTVDFGALPNATTKNVAHNITNLLRVIRHQMWTRRSSDGVMKPIPTLNTATTNEGPQLTIDGTNISVRSGTNQSAFDQTWITLWYLKT